MQQQVLWSDWREVVTGCAEVSDLTFRHKMQMRGLQPRTIAAYSGVVQRARSWVRDHHYTTLAEIDEEGLWQYVSQHIPETYSSRIMARNGLRAYFRVVGRVDPPLWVVDVPPEPRWGCRAISDQAAKVLAQTAVGWVSGADGLGVLVGLYVALRRFEIAKLRWEDFYQQDSQWWVVVRGKGRRVDSVPVHERVMEKLEWWKEFSWPDPLDSRVRPGDEFIFQGMRGDAITLNTVNDWCKRMAGEAGVGHVTPHQLRHTCLATINDTTHDLRAAQEFGRHAKPETTARYTRVGQDRLLGAVDSLDYL